ncbi:MAG: DUF3857 domain-containing protein [Verrucomicrobia subdivision 3 bacterium]|nr:DUF3857 domain-containing protein [Limisphaerales bacterium]
MACAQSNPTERFIPVGSRVILLPSLAGDAESERAHREQVNALLEIAGASQAERVLLFGEHGEVAIPQGLGCERAPATRTNFLDAGNRFAESSNHLVVIAWGHGGTQGQTPVFHVRGPRLTAEDFKAVAEKAGASTWVLMFRGSGRFAKELASPMRRIISSEGDSIFRSDPIAMGVFIKTLRANPGAGFENLAELLGPAVAKWYDDQSLARTEEPTLWAGVAPPRALAAAAQPLEKVPETASAKSTGDALKKKESGDVPPQSKDTAAWADIQRVKPEDYADADAVVLRRRMAYTLGSSPAITAEHEEYIQVLTPEGKEAGDFDISYSPPEERIEFLDCEVQRRDGSVTRVDPDDIREGGDWSPDSKERRKFFSMPDVTPGAVMHVRYKREWQKFPLPHVTLKLPLVDEAPVLNSVVQVSVPKDSPFHFRFEHVAAGEPTITQSEYSASYTWRFDKLEAWEPEPLSPPDSQPALQISTFPDWKAFAGWYERIIRLADQVTLEITNRAVEVTRHCRSDGEKVIALYNYVTGLRYVAVPLGVNSFRPHAAEGVLRNQYGDCKDKANLLNALLRSQGIEAHLVLMPRFGQAHDSLPGFAFNHAISHVALGEETLWVDTTDDVCRFGMLPPGDYGRRVLVVDGVSEKLVLLPRPAASSHVVTITTAADLRGLGEEAKVEITATAKGYVDYGLRETARRVPRNGPVPLLSTSFRLMQGSFALERQEFTPPSDLESDFKWQASGNVIGLGRTDANGGALTAPLWLPGEWSLALNRRRTPLFLNDGYPLLLRQTAEIKLPDASGDLKLPSKQQNREGPLRWSLEWMKPAPRTVRIELETELPNAELSPERTRTFQKQLRELFVAVSRMASFSSAE